jgi:hypothetical protein
LQPAQVRERLLDLAYDASSYLRRNSRPVVRISAAVLLAASMAACDATSGPTDSGQAPLATVAPLAQEVRSGLPTEPGRYPILEDSLRRDGRGVYYFSWLAPGATAGPGTPASASLVRLARGETNYLEMQERGDPILYLRHNASVQLSASDLQTSNRFSGGPSFVYWRPFFGGGTFGPAYYDPPVRTIPSSGMVDGASGSSAPRPAADRVIGATRAVSGRAGGAGSGTAASQRAGVDLSRTGGKSAVAAPKSSGFSSGTAGVGAATAKGSS